jgi:hypothetical protein
MDYLIKLVVDGYELLQLHANQIPFLALGVIDWLFDLVRGFFQNGLHFFIFLFNVIWKTLFFSALFVGIIVTFFMVFYGLITGKLRTNGYRCPLCEGKVKKSEGKCPHCHGYYKDAWSIIERTNQPPE